MNKFTRYRRALPLTAAVIIGTLWAAAYGADGEADDGVATIINRIPAGYRFSEGIRGDLNGDGMEDDVIIIQATDKKAIVRDDRGGRLVDRNRRGVMIFFKNGDDYKLVLENRRILASEHEDGGVYFAPELSVNINKGNLYFHYGHGRYGWWTYTFRYRKSEFELIGYDNHDFYYKEIISINFLTKKLLLKDCVHKDNEEKCADDCCSNIYKERWKDLNDILIVKEPIILRNVADMEDIMHNLLREGWSE